MNLRKFFSALSLLVISTGLNLQAQHNSEKKMEWFEDAKLGIFIHWGIYSVDGISESWAFFNNYTSHANYMKQLGGFTASNYKPEEWIDLIQQSGARYTVITTKHHDGVSLWDSKAQRAITTVKDAAAKKDVLTPFISALKKTDLKTGLYYSLPDWSHPWYDINTRTKKRYDLQDEPKRWADFVEYYQSQLKELSTKYNPDLIWFDGDWEHNSEQWKAPQTLSLLKSYNPDIIINSRLNHLGDYETPEQGVPITRPKNRYWELCYTMNDSWGYQPFDTHYKTPNMIVRTLVECISMGGNLLLDIGPKEDGTIPEPQIAILKELGRWTAKHQEAVYGTREGLTASFLKDKSAFSKDGKTLFVYLENVKDQVRITGLRTKPKSVRIIGTSETIIPKYDGYHLNLSLSPDNFDSAVTVVAITFDEKPEFRVHEAEDVPSLQSILSMEDASKAISTLVKWTDAGSNLLKGKLQSDGSEIDSDLKFANKRVKEWILKHAEVLHNAQVGIASGHYAGATALSGDKQTLYLFVEGRPTGPLAVKGLKSGIARIRIVGEGSMIDHDIFNKLYWSPIPGIVYIDLPASRLDKDITVVAVLLDKPIELYREEVGAIESNL
ncbi:alpha-L-fucosidase [Sphingobacterium lumbrici]|uniref:alpha-L-fucosidase n=1 Tax=Sphingobacterium lumbrici TaxID=2559600 RepID=UPI00112E1E09|nr:alpha-L-fucosidase [Sphingobacterium lumbrici]